MKVVVMREILPISEERLRFCLQHEYGLTPSTFELITQGLDTRASVYRMLDERETAYLLKLRLDTLYEPACFVPRYLHDAGIESVVAPLPTTKGKALWSRVDNWFAVLYPFLAGETSWQVMVDEQWKTTGQIFRKIHRVSLPASDFELLRKESFDPTQYTDWTQSIDATYRNYMKSPSQQALQASWRTHQPTIHALLTTLEQLAADLRSHALPYVICHADLHPGNLLRDQTYQVFVLDWDEVMLAPKERDFLFVGNPLPSPSPFFQGYGAIDEVDWVALTYYRYERVVQDLLAFAQDVFFSNDLTETTKADFVTLFHGVLAPDGEMIAAAHSSAVHLPPGFNLPTIDI